MDALSGFWQLEIDEESAKMCNTLFFRPCHLPIPKGLDGVPVYMDLVGCCSIQQDPTGGNTQENTEKWTQIVEVH